jgi:anti-sigma-K factor RskA
MTPDVHTLAGGYALNALPDDEEEMFRQHLAVCPACQSEVGEFRATAARLGAAAAAEVPASLKPAVLQQVRVTRQLPPPRSVSPIRRVRLASSWLAAAAALLLVVAVGVGVREHQQAATLQAQQQLVVAVLTAPDSLAVRKHIGKDGALTLVSSSRLNRAVVLVNRLPHLNAAHTYQMWLVNGKRARSAGTIPPSSATTGTTTVVSPLDGATELAVTIEPAGGSRQPTTPVLAAARLS